MIEEILGDEYTKNIVQELGLQNNSPDEQANIIALLGENIFKRVMLEIFTALPKEHHDKLESYLGSQDVLGMRKFLLQHIPDLDKLIRHHAEVEYESTKTGFLTRLQGVN